MTTTRELLLAERARARTRAAALDREFAGIAAAASEAGTDDEHDPEGATLAFERQHTAALLAQALEQIAGIDAAIGRLDAGTYGICVQVRPARRAGPAGSTPGGRHLRPVRPGQVSRAWSCNALYRDVACC